MKRGRGNKCQGQLYRKLETYTKYVYLLTFFRSLFYQNQEQNFQIYCNQEVR
jgi:hypothetical protein